MFKCCIHSVKRGIPGQEASYVLFKLHPMFRFLQCFLQDNNGRRAQTLSCSTCPQVVDDIQLYDLLPLNLQDGKRQLLKTLSLNAALFVASCSAPKLHLLGSVFHLWCRQKAKPWPAVCQHLHYWSLPENANSLEASLPCTVSSSFC